MSAIPLKPSYGPNPRGVDSVAEIIAEMADISALAPADRRVHFDRIVAAYSSAAFADALLCILDNQCASGTAHAPMIGIDTET